ncbi:MAG TPA: ABC-F family ATP-binding cassette domain-containing protein, partial [Chlamydiales bacterium]|nr:ABC-F family ATP-binding cassette domain-containing protein [Chlamydiales bacterium]
MAVVLKDISKKMGARLLFENVSASFEAGKRYGLTGPNGAGKSTLLKIMMGQIDANSGEIVLPKRVGYLRQNIEDFQHLTLIDVVIMGNARLWEALSERELLYEKEMTDAIGMRLGDLEEIVAIENGYTADSDAEMLLIGMGVPAEFHTQKMKEVPSDFQFRAMLCQALFGEPEALLLDEPTNHLDLESISWLEKFLMGYNGTLIVVSHDRHFLNSVTTDIADIDYDTIITYTGNYDQMVMAKSAAAERMGAEAKSKEKKVAQLQEFVQKFGAGTRASQVKSRMREIERLQPQEQKQSNIQRPYIRFKIPERASGKIALKCKKIGKSYDKEVFKDFSFELERGDKVGIIGNNGRGKTTLIKMLAGVLEPDMGIVERGHQADIGYFPQNHNDAIDKSSSETAFDWLKSQKQGLYDQEVRGALGRMLFSGDDAFKPIKALSGGETARLLLAKLMLFDHNVLVLDEPNNHLDLESVSALAWGIEDFTGAALVVSHDRDLIDKVANKIIAFE